MTTNIVSLIPSLNSSNQITSIVIAGDSDRPRIRLDITSQSSPAFMTVQTIPNPATGTWGDNGSVTLTAGNDFLDGDVKCDDILDIDLFWLDIDTWVREDSYPIQMDMNCDQCSLSITSLEGIPAPVGQSGMQEVIVKGTANVCSDVTVSVFDANNSPSTATAGVIGGQWEAHLVAGNPGVGTRLKSYDCDEDHRVLAQCSAARDCFDEKTLPLACKDCRQFADVNVTNATGMNVVNPVVGALQCVPAGAYTITVTSPNPSDVSTYTWYKNQDEGNPLGHTLSLPVTILDGENVSYTVTIVTVRGCTPTRTVIFACGGPLPPPDDDDSPPPLPDDDDSPPPLPGDDDSPPLPPPPSDGACDLCCIWFIINIIAILATLIAIFIAGCVFLGADPTSNTIAVALVIAVTISIILWGIICNGRSGGSCTPILRLIDILDVLSIVAGIVALLMGVTSPCAIAFWINAGFLQWVRRILQTIAQLTGCLPNPWFR